MVFLGDGDEVPDVFDVLNEFRDFLFCRVDLFQVSFERGFQVAVVRVGGGRLSVGGRRVRGPSGCVTVSSVSLRGCRGGCF